MIDNRNDFTSFTRFLKKLPDQFREGTSFQDEQGHYFITTCIESRGQKRKDIWIRKFLFEKFLQKAVFIPKKQCNNGLVYFIQEENNYNRFKIGYTTNLTERLVQLQTGNPELLVVYQTIDNVSIKVEHQIQHYFKNNHIRGEWYNVTTEQIESICACISLLSMHKIVELL